MLTVEERSYEILEAIGETAAISVASGRYRHSEELSPGLRFWSTSFDRDGSDALGVQFTARALGQAKALRKAFMDAGFEERDTRDVSKVTFCKRILRLAGGGLDVTSLTSLKAEILSIVSPDTQQGQANPDEEDFVSFIRRSPLYGVTLDVGERVVEPERDTF